MVFILQMGGAVSDYLTHPVYSIWLKPVQSLSFLSFPRPQYNQSAVSKRFLLAVSPLKLLNSTDYEGKKGTARSLS